MDEPFLRLSSMERDGHSFEDSPLLNLKRLSGPWEMYGAIFEQQMCFLQACSGGQHVPSVCYPCDFRLKDGELVGG